MKAFFLVAVQVPQGTKGTTPEVDVSWLQDSALSSEGQVIFTVSPPEDLEHLPVVTTVIRLDGDRYLQQARIILADGGQKVRTSRLFEATMLSQRKDGSDPQPSEELSSTPGLTQLSGEVDEMYRFSGLLVSNEPLIEGGEGDPYLDSQEDQG